MVFKAGAKLLGIVIKENIRECLRPRELKRYKSQVYENVEYDFKRFERDLMDFYPVDPIIHLRRFNREVNSYLQMNKESIENLKQRVESVRQKTVRSLQEKEGVKRNEMARNEVKGNRMGIDHNSHSKLNNNDGDTSNTASTTASTTGTTITTKNNDIVFQFLIEDSIVFNNFGSMGIYFNQVLKEVGERLYCENQIQFNDFPLLKHFDVNFEYYWKEIDYKLLLEIMELLEITIKESEEKVFSIKMNEDVSTNVNENNVVQIFRVLDILKQDIFRNIYSRTSKVNPLAVFDLLYKKGDGRYCTKVMSMNRPFCEYLFIKEIHYRLQREIFGIREINKKIIKEINKSNNKCEFGLLISDFGVKFNVYNFKELLKSLIKVDPLTKSLFLKVDKKNPVLTYKRAYYKNKMSIIPEKEQVVNVSDPLFLKNSKLDIKKEATKIRNKSFKDFFIKKNDQVHYIKYVIIERNRNSEALIKIARELGCKLIVVSKKSYSSIEGEIEAYKTFQQLDQLSNAKEVVLNMLELDKLVVKDRNELLELIRILSENILSKVQKEPEGFEEFLEQM
ncbi:uncharacterized protein ASCRUDRAFT_77290, partial [Ascoidea rubescens DSM 1968]